MSADPHLAYIIFICSNLNFELLQERLRSLAAVAREAGLKDDNEEEEDEVEGAAEASVSSSSQLQVKN